MNQRSTLFSGALFSGLGIALGAFGAHALKEILTANGRQHAFETAVHYQLFHGVALLVIGILMKTDDLSKTLKWASAFLCLGIIFFSGSLYALSLHSLGFFGIITPVGGLFFLIGWALLLVFIVQKK
jgi:uncharacterized membrane protein YgdD (TMEM256/DUF423 family)